MKHSQKRLINNIKRQNAPKRNKHISLMQQKVLPLQPAPHIKCYQPMKIVHLMMLLILVNIEAIPYRGVYRHLFVLCLHD